MPFGVGGPRTFGAFTEVEVSVRSIAVLRVSVEPLEDACLIRAIGEFDSSTADLLRSPLQAARADGVTALVDLAGVSFIDSAGLRVLLEAGAASDRHEWPWFIVRPSPAVLRLVEVSRTASRLPLVRAERTPAQASVVPLRAAERTRARRVVHQ
jgi:anti-sigma B factor antagonist